MKVLTHRFIPTIKRAIKHAPKTRSLITYVKPKATLQKVTTSSKGIVTTLNFAYTSKEYQFNIPVTFVNKKGFDDKNRSHVFGFPISIGCNYRCYCCKHGIEPYKELPPNDLISLAKKSMDFIEEEHSIDFTNEVPKFGLNKGGDGFGVKNTKERLEALHDFSPKSIVRYLSIFPKGATFVEQELIDKSKEELIDFTLDNPKAEIHLQLSIHGIGAYQNSTPEVDKYRKIHIPKGDTLEKINKWSQHYRKATKNQIALNFILKEDTPCDPITCTTMLLGPEEDPVIRLRSYISTDGTTALNSSQIDSIEKNWFKAGYKHVYGAHALPDELEILSVSGLETHYKKF